MVRKYNKPFSISTGLKSFPKTEMANIRKIEGAQPQGAELVEWLRGKSLYGYGVSRKLPVKPLKRNRIQ